MRGGFFGFLSFQRIFKVRRGPRYSQVCSRGRVDLRVEILKLHKLTIPHLLPLLVRRARDERKDIAWQVRLVPRLVAGEAIVQRGLVVAGDERGLWRPVAGEEEVQEVLLADHLPGPSRFITPILHTTGAYVWDFMLVHG